MRKKAFRVKLELTSIFIASALLTLSAIGLAGKTLAVSSSKNAEPYPCLYAGECGEICSLADKTVYLTFDDGPSRNTQKILDILLEKDVKATFFVTAQCRDDEPEFTAEMLRRIVLEGHSIGLHSYTHDFKEIYRSADAYMADLCRLNDYIFECTGIYPQILRFPGGSKTANCGEKIMKDIQSELTRRGYPWYDWHIVSGDDSASRSVGYLANRIIKGMEGRDSAIVLLHDNNTPKTTPEAAGMVIDSLRERGYSFDRLTPETEPHHIQ